MLDTRETTQQEREALHFLNALRESGQTNMFGAAPYVETEFGVDRRESVRLLKLWMENFNEEGNYENVLNS
jgi:hypothetical protein